jgi:thiol-disulfide isomerase/thioredoxin
MRSFGGIALFLAGCASQSTAALPEGRVALRLEDVDGEPVTLGAMRGKVVLVTIVTTWSDYALLEVPRFKALAEKHAEDLAIVCIALDEDLRMIQIFRDTFEIPYPVTTVRDKQQFTSELGPFGRITIIPTSILLDRDGNVAARMDGMWPVKVLEAAVQKVAGKI